MGRNTTERKSNERKMKKKKKTKWVGNKRGANKMMGKGQGREMGLLCTPAVGLHPAGSQHPGLDPSILGQAGPQCPGLGWIPASQTSYQPALPWLLGSLGFFQPASTALAAFQVPPQAGEAARGLCVEGGMHKCTD